MNRQKIMKLLKFRKNKAEQEPEELYIKNAVSEITRSLYSGIMATNLRFMSLNVTEVECNFKIELVPNDFYDVKYSASDNMYRITKHR